jgi:opacity protein-like surface antigen
MTRALIIAACLLAAPSAWAQRIEVAPLTIAGYRTAAPIDEQAAGVNDLEIQSSFSWGAQGTYLFANGTGAEVWWRRQRTGVSLTAGTNSVTLFYMNTNDLDANVIYQFGPNGVALRPFVSGGVGVTFLSADGLDDETKFAWNVGAGLKWFFLRNFGARIDGRYRATRLNTSPSDYCAPFAFCQSSLKAFNLGGGLEIRF